MAKKYVSIEKLGLYDEKIKKVITDGDAAALASAKTYAEGLGVNYDASGSAATAEANAKAYADGKDAAIAEAKKAGTDAQAAAEQAQKEVDALELVVDTKAAQSDLTALSNKVGNVPADQTVMGIITNIQENAYDDEPLRTEISAELAKKADKTQVSTDIQTAVKAEEDARKEAIEDVQGAVDTLSGTHATDKKALEDAIALKADKTALDGVSEVANAAATKVALQEEVNRATGEEARIEGLVTAEVAKAREEEGKLDARLVEVEAFFKLAEGEQLDEALDTLKELQDFVNGEGAAADQMVLDIAANKKSIEDMDAAYKLADQTLQGNIDTLSGVVDTKAAASDVTTLAGRVTTAEGDIDAVEGRMATAEGKITTLEGEMDDVQAAVATKAEAQALADAIETLEGADADLDERIDAIEGKLGESGDVATDIATAKQEAIDAAKSDATTKANQAEANAIAKANELNTAMDARVGVVEAKAHEHANKALLDTYTQTEVDLADAVAKKHAHSNMDVLEAITAVKVAAWDAAEQAAKTYADGLNTAMDTRMVAVETWQSNMIECSEEDITKLFA